MSDKESVEELPSHITKDLPHTMTQHKHLQLLLQQRYLNQATNSEPKAHRYTEPAANSNNLLQASPDRMVSLGNIKLVFRFPSPLLRKKKSARFTKNSKYFNGYLNM